MLLLTGHLLDTSTAYWTPSYVKIKLPVRIGGGKRMVGRGKKWVMAGGEEQAQDGAKMAAASTAISYSLGWGTTWVSSILNSR